MNRFCHPSTRYHSDAKDGFVLKSVPSPNCCFAPTIISYSLISFVILALMTDLRASAQQQPANAKGKPAAGKEKEAGAKGKEKPKAAAEDLNINSTDLPKKYVPPQKPLAIMNLEMPIASPQEIEKLKKEYQKFTKVRQDCDMSEAGRKVVENSIRYRLALMTKLTPQEMRENPNKLPLLRQDLLRDITQIGNAARGAAAINAMAEVVNKETYRQIPELLKNNFYVRLNAVLILNEMDYRDGAAYIPTYETLLQVIQAKDIRDDEKDGQPEAIKIEAVNGLIRILRFANCPIKDRTIIAHAIIEELAKKDGHWWRQERMVEVLRYCGISGVDAGNNNKPFVIECLLSIVKDSAINEKDKEPVRDWRVRGKACVALGRVPIPAGVKPEEIVNAVADFALDLSNNAAAKPANPIWKGCFWDLYLTFRPNNRRGDEDRDAENKRIGGLLESAKATAQPVYDVILPIVIDVLINGKAPEAGNVKKLADSVKLRRELVQKGN